MGCKNCILIIEPPIKSKHKGRETREYYTTVFLKKTMMS